MQSGRDVPIPDGEKTMTLSRLQLPPRPDGASQSACAGPPAIGTRFSLPSAKNAMCRLSGDQNGNVPPSVP